MNKLSNVFGSLPRVSLGTFPTPLTEMKRLRCALGGPEKSPRIFIKRDDLTGLAFGGNKVRKLEYLIADALEQNATDIITAGAAQSNHCRATVAAAVVSGMRPTLVLGTDQPDQAPQGNLLLDRMMGAHIVFVSRPRDRVPKMKELAAQMEAEGRRPYVIPVGGSNPLGTAGYLTMAQELATQLQAFDVKANAIYYANGSSGTHASIALGCRLFDLSSVPCSVMVSPDSPEEQALTIANANGAAELVGSTLRLTTSDLAVVDGYVGERYGAPTESGDEAVDLVAKTEAIFLDPVYTGKAMGALIDHIRTGQIGADASVVFVHTGGTPSIFAHAERLAARAGAV